MACNCRKNKNTVYVWTSDDKTETVKYTTEIQARAKVIRAGGSYLPVAKV